MSRLDLNTGQRGALEALEAWRAVLGSDRTLSASEAMAAYGFATSGDERRIVGALRPRTVDDIPELVRTAGAHRVPLYPISTGRNWGYGCALPASDGCVLLDLSGLDRISDFDAELGIVTVEPGVTQAALATFLRERGGHFLVPVSGAGPQASILGNALERGYGITPVGDHFLAVQSLEAVLPDGRVYRRALDATGAGRANGAFKWGVGPYVDGLFTQSGFGVVTRITIALARVPDSTKAFFFGLRDEADLPAAVERIRRVLGRLPGLVGGINLMNELRVLAMTAPYPRESTGPDGLLAADTVRAHARRYGITPWTGFGTLYGTRRTVRAAEREIRAVLRGTASRLLFVSPAGARRLRRLAGLVRTKAGAALADRAALLESSLELVAGRPSETALPLSYWMASSSTPASIRTMNPNRDRCGLIWYTPLIVMDPATVTQYVAFVERVMRRHGIEPLITLTSLSERCFDSSVPLLFDRDDASAVTRARACYRALLDEGAKLGFVPYRVGLIGMDWLVRSGTVAWDLVGALKRAVDPLDIISPARYAPHTPEDLRAKP